MEGWQDMPSGASAPQQPATLLTDVGPQASERGADGRRRLPLYLALGLTLLIVVVWEGSLDNGFVNFDDPDYVTENAHVQAGWTGAGLRWAATAVVVGNWQPLTLASHMLDCQLFGLNPRGPHLTNLLLHLATTLLLFQFLRLTTGRELPSAMVAALFAVHPTHVESVAWIAERKDVLCAGLWMVTLLAYLRYVRRPSVTRYLWVALAFVLALLAKPMAVTLPAILLLLDIWPLGRLPGGGERATEIRRGIRWRRLGALFVEKLPLLALSAGAAAITLHVQAGAGAMRVPLSLPLRLANALTSTVGYLGKTFFPLRLGVFYPLASSIPMWQPVVALILLLVITGWALMSVERAPYRAVGWLWYLVTLTPVVGIIQVGAQAMADRYTYLPSIGLYWVVVSSLADLADRMERREGRQGTPAVPAQTRRTPPAVVGLAVASVAVLGMLSLRTMSQIATWRDSISLFGHALTVADSYLAHEDLADAFAVTGDRAAADREYRAALTLQPRNPKALAGLGVALVSWGRPVEALPLLERSVQINPSAEEPRIALAAARAGIGDLSGAATELRTVLVYHPESGLARDGLSSLRNLQIPARPH
jgi:hypothetical protein